MENGQPFTPTNQTAAKWTYVAILFELQKLHTDENVSFHSDAFQYIFVEQRFKFPFLLITDKKVPDADTHVRKTRMQIL